MSKRNQNPKNNFKVILDFDDFSPRNSNLGLLEDLKDHYAGFKATVFLVPWEIRWGEQTPITDERFEPFCEAMKIAEPWLEVALHGFTHAPHEFANISYEDAKKRITLGEKMLINRGITYAKLFKAPGWEISEEGKRAVADLGFKLVEDHWYNWNLKDSMPEKIEDFLWGHGHIQMTMGNGLEESMSRILTIPANSDFTWVSEYLNVNRIDSRKLLEEQKRILEVKPKDNQNGIE